MSPVSYSLLDPYFRGLDILALAVCAPGVAFHLHRSDPRPQWRRVDARGLTHPILIQAADAIAASADLPFDSDSAFLLNASLHGDHLVSIIGGPAVSYGSCGDPRGGFALLVRCPDVRPSGTPSPHKIASGAHRGGALRPEFPVPDGPLSVLFDVALRGKPILISGPTNSGKTHLLRFLADALNPALRVLVLESVREVSPSGSHRVHINLADSDSHDVGSNAFTVDRLARLFPRFAPDVTILGEVTPVTASFLASQIRSGPTPHVWTTIHASSASEAISELVSHAASPAGDGAAQADIRRLVRENFYIVQLLPGPPYGVISGVVPPLSDR